MLHFDTSAKPPETEPEREELFAIDGKAYTIPRRIHPLDMAQYTYLVDTLGSDSAGVWALQQALGNEGFAAYMNLPHHVVSPEDFARIMAVVTGRFIGVTTEVPGDDPKSPEPGESGDAVYPAPANIEPPDSEVWPESEPVGTAR